MYVATESSKKFKNSPEANQQNKGRSHFVFTDNRREFKRQAQLCTAISANSVVKPNSPDTIIQLHGERTAVRNIYLSQGATAQPVSRGNRRGSVIRTNGDSRVRLSAFRHYTGTLCPLKAEAITWAGTTGIPHASTFVNNHWQSIYGWTARQCEIGNCGEFASMLTEELLRTTTNQWVHKCCMYPRDRYDHAFVITYPAEIPAGKTMPADVDKKKAIVADAWDGYKVMNTETFCNGRNAYGAMGLNHTNIYILSAEEATETDTIAPLKNSIDIYVQAFNVWYSQELNNPDSCYSKLKKQPIQYLERGTFGTQGSDITQGFQDFRPMSVLFPVPQLPFDDDTQNAQAWWTHPAGTYDVSTLNESGWTIFSAASRRDQEIQNTTNAVKFGQFLDGASRYTPLRLSEYSIVLAPAVKAANLAKLNTCISAQTLINQIAICNLLADTDLTNIFNMKTDIGKVVWLNHINFEKTTNYLNTLTIQERAAIFNLPNINSEKTKNYLNALALQERAAILNLFDINTLATYFKKVGLTTSSAVLSLMNVNQLLAFVRQSKRHTVIAFLTGGDFPYRDEIIKELPAAMAADIISGLEEREQNQILNKISENQKREIEREMTRRRAASGGIPITS